MWHEKADEREQGECEQSLQITAFRTIADVGGQQSVPKPKSHSTVFHRILSLRRFLNENDHAGHDRSHLLVGVVF
jgi:hypothetical protein